MTVVAMHGATALVGRRLDGWLTGWIAVVLWVVAQTGAYLGHPLGSFGIPTYWPAAVLGAMHFGMSYRLAYGRPGAVRERPVALAIFPIALAAALMVIVLVTVLSGTEATRNSTRALVTVVFLTTTWHYIKQVYGIVRLGARYRGITLTAVDVRVLRYCLYPLWLVGAAQVLSIGTSTRYAGLSIGLGLVPAFVFSVVRVIGLACAVAIASVVWRSARRHQVWPPALMVAPYAAAFLWLLAPTDYLGATLALGALHGVQYLACCYRAEVATSGSLSPRTALRWVEVFGGAACGGLLLTVWLPQRLNMSVATSDAPLLFTAVCFVFLNLHHYVIDAVIWRSGGQLVRSMTELGRPRIAVSDPGRLVQTSSI